MKYQERTDIAAKFHEYVEHGGPREAGIHVTDLIRDIEIKLKMLQDSKVDAAASLRMSIGFMWEEVFSLAMRTVFSIPFVEQVPVEANGIIGTADGALVAEDRITELKATWMSPTRDPRDTWRYMAQIKAYCRALGLSKARMYVLHLGFNPVVRVHDFDFTEQELEENWQMLLNHKRTMEEE